MCIIDRSASLRDLDMAPTFERREQHEQICRAVALVLVVVACRLSRPYRDRRACLCNKLLGCLIETDQWSRRIMRTRIMAATNAALAVGGITQYSLRCGLMSF